MVSQFILLLHGQRADVEPLAPILERAAVPVKTARTGAAAIAFGEPALVVFDTRAMRSSGTRTCRRLRRTWPKVPIIHCRLAGVKLDESAEATLYLEEPFTPRILLNRIKKLLPVSDTAEEAMRFGEIVVFTRKRTIRVGDEDEQPITPKLLRLLLVLLETPGEVVTRGELIQRVWNTTYLGDTRTLDVHIRWLRELVEENASQPERLQTVRGVGYRFLVES